MDKEPIKIGRLSLKIEKKAGWDLTDPFVYLENEAADKLAEKRPKDYLRIIERAGEIIRKPDFLYSSDGTLKLVRAYPVSGFLSFYFVLLSNKGKVLLKKIGLCRPESFEGEKAIRVD